MLAGVQYAYSEGTALDNNALAGDPYQPADHNIVEVSIDGPHLLALFPGTTSVLMHYTETCGNDVFNLKGDVVLVPEPGTWALFGLGTVLVGACVGWRRRRSSATSAA